MTTEEFNKFHHDLVQYVANYLADKELPEGSWMLNLTIDDLPSLVKYKSWTPYNDSYLGITDNHGEELQWEM